MNHSKHSISPALVSVAAMCLSLGIGSASAQSSNANPSSSSTSGSSSYNSNASSSTSTASSDTLKHADKKFLTKVAEGGQLEIALAQLASERASSPEVRSYAQQLLTDHLAMSQQLTQLAERKGIQADIAEYTPNTTAADVSAATSAATSHTGMASTGSTGYNSSGSTVASSSSANPNAAGAPTGRMTSDSSKDWNDPTKDRHYKKLAAKSGADFDKEYISMMVSDHEDDIAMFNKKIEAKNEDADVQSFASQSLPTLQTHLQRAQQLAGTTK